MTLEEIYQQKCAEVSDINEHLPTLREYAGRCERVREFGVRGIVSTWALLAGRPKFLVSYDITHPGIPAIQQVSDLAQQNGTAFRFVTADTRTAMPEQTDLLFIDTFHTYGQLTAELDRHGFNVCKFIILHDTETFGKKGEAGDEAGLLPAIDWFIHTYPHWRIRAQYYFNNGLTILERK